MGSFPMWVSFAWPFPRSSKMVTSYAPSMASCSIPNCAGSILFPFESDEGHNFSTAPHVTNDLDCGYKKRTLDLVPANFPEPKSSSPNSLFPNILETTPSLPIFCRPCLISPDSKSKQTEILPTPAEKTPRDIYSRRDRL